MILQWFFNRKSRFLYSKIDDRTAGGACRWGRGRGSNCWWIIRKMDEFLLETDGVYTEKWIFLSNISVTARILHEWPGGCVGAWCWIDGWAYEAGAGVAGANLNLTMVNFCWTMLELILKLMVWYLPWLQRFVSNGGFGDFANTCLPTTVHCKTGRKGRGVQMAIVMLGLLLTEWIQKTQHEEPAGTNWEFCVFYWRIVDLYMHNWQVRRKAMR